MTPRTHQHLLLALVAFGASCSQPAAPMPAQASNEVHVGPAAPHQGPRAPFVLSLTGPANAEAAQVTLTATLRSQLANPAPVTLEIVLPAGVGLLAGQEREQVMVSPQQPVTTRQYVLSLPAPLREPIRVRARLQQDPAMGAFAERIFPETMPTPVTSGGATTIVGRLPVAVPTEAVPVR